MASADVIESSAIVGVYEVKPSSYRLYNNNRTIYNSNCTIRITDNLDGTYHVSDLLGGYYDQRAGYGSSYAMGGEISIVDDGTVILVDSYVRGWDDSLLGLTGKYDVATSTFTIEAEYVDGMKFFQTWIKTASISQDPAFSSDGFNYKIGENNTVSVISKRVKYSGDIIIPSQVIYGGITYSVTSIDENAFSDCTDLTSVIIPNTITSICKYAFQNCTGLTSVTIPNSVTSIDYAFLGCTGLTSVTISNSVTSLNSTFNGCTGLTSVTIPNSVTSLSNTFAGCTGLTSVIIPNSVTEMWGVFYGCTGLSSVTIPNSVKTLNNTFEGCTGLKSVVIPNSVTDIGGAFQGCTGLTSINIPNSVTNISYSFGGCIGLTSITIPNSVTKITGAFWGCSNLTSVTIPNSVRNIDTSFSDCTALTTVVIPNSVTSIGGWAFRNCIALPSVIIPNSVTSIGDNAFSGCTGLTDFYCFTENIPDTNPNAFEESNIQNAVLHVKASKVDAYKTEDPWKDFKQITALQQCAKPTIQYDNGKLFFNSKTEGAICHSTITDSDIQSYSGNEVQLSVAYNINVYATRMDHEVSDVETATLCWIDANPTTEGITDGAANVRAKAVMIQNDNNVISISGTAAGMQISVYDVSDMMIGSATSNSNVTTIPTTLQPGSIAIIKIGNKSVKVAMK